MTPTEEAAIALMVSDVAEREKAAKARQNSANSNAKRNLLQRETVLLAAMLQAEQEVSRAMGGENARLQKELAAVRSQAQEEDRWSDELQIDRDQWRDLARMLAARVSKGDA